MITNERVGIDGHLSNQIFQFAILKELFFRKGYEFFFPENALQRTHFHLFRCFQLRTDYLKSVDTKTFKKFKEPHFHFDPGIFEVEDNTVLEGFFQSEKYFEKCREELLKELIFHPYIYNEAVLAWGSLPRESFVSVHVRRTGYLGLSHKYKILAMDYYTRAMCLFPNSLFLIFSDDIEWCKDNFLGDRILFSENRSGYVDMCLMTMCDHHIIANSTFSWWGAYLNKKSSKKVVVPAKWFSDPGFDEKDLIPNQWIRI